MNIPTITPPAQSRTGVTIGPDGDETSPSACPSIDVWQRLLLDQLTFAVRESAEVHLSSCEICRRAITLLASDGDLHPPDAGDGPGLVGDQTLSMLRRIARLPPEASLGNRSSNDSEYLAFLETAGFTNLAEVGRGGAGVVFRGLQPGLGRTVAIKMLSVGKGAGLAARIHREAQILGRLKHPYVVAIHATGEIAGTPYLVMEWIAGGSLQDRIDQGKLPYRIAVRLVAQLAQAIEAAHALGIVHRDLKPANVLLQPADKPGAPFIAKLTDFGLAQDVESDQRLTATGVVMGTPNYMAPEQTGLVSTAGAVGPACDVYGLGAVLYAALSGKPPHSGQSTLDTLVKVAWSEPESLNRHRSEIPRDLETIVARCLRAKPSDRYRSAGDLADDLQRFLDGLPISARPYSSFELVGNWLWRRPAAAVALVLITLLIGGAVAGGFYHIQSLNRSLKQITAQEQKVVHALAAEKAAQESTREVLDMVTQRMMVRGPVLDQSDKPFLEELRRCYELEYENRNPHSESLGIVLGRGFKFLATLSESIGSSGDALRDLERAILIAEEIPESEELQKLRYASLAHRSDILTNLCRWDEAVAVQDRLAEMSREKSPAVAMGHESRGLHIRILELMKQQKFAEALVLADQAISLQKKVLSLDAANPDHWLNLLLTYHNRGLSLFALNRREESLKCFLEGEWQASRFLVAHPQHSDLYYWRMSRMMQCRIDLQAEKGRFNEALEICDRVRDLLAEWEGKHPESNHLFPECTEFVAKLFQICDLQGRPVAAEKDVSDAVNKGRDWLKYRSGSLDAQWKLCQNLMLQAKILLRTGRPVESQKPFDEVIARMSPWLEQAPSEMPVVLLLTEAYWLSAQGFEATGDFTEACRRLHVLLTFCREIEKNAISHKLVELNLRLKDLAGARAAAARIQGDPELSNQAASQIRTAENK